MSQSKYRFVFIQPFAIDSESEFLTWTVEGEKEQLLMNYENLGLGRYLEGVDWDFHPGPRAPYGDWPVENREEFALVAAARLAIVKEACESGRYNGIMLLGGGEPGALEAREIGKRYNIPVTSCATAQFQVASMVGQKFSIIDLAESHAMYYRNLVTQAGMENRFASMRLIPYPLGRPGYDDQADSLPVHKARALRGEDSSAVKAAVDAAEAAILEDGAQVITFGCSGTFWLQPFVKAGLLERGWDVPVLEGYSAAFTQLKLLVDLGLDASSLMFPADRPMRSRDKIL
ncbi:MULTISPECIES: aspartate/glutamate racemase family protein [unclassified Arthrobacter]|uniref:aspartate/glutamate racemase family protein n=1 Tax=unclassified Arthrobacter TaxID=235627 RepID=UPI001C859FEE|nr:aspartate/glutamate racemase family protein [Arthrobacter sp. MAHUQ-56]MBX7444622.1 aspartate/glutamate racemase family protein [Arthrobacter sp. MAHUQ-56]